MDQAMRHATRRRRAPAGRALLLAAALAAGFPLAAAGAAQDAAETQDEDTPPTLEQTRLAMDKWIETQQIISRERKEWQQGRDVLLGRLELVKKEITTLEEQIAEKQSAVAESDRKRSELLAEDAELRASLAQLGTAVDGMEDGVRVLLAQVPEPVATRLQPLIGRLPADAAAKARVSVAERYQNVLGILNDLNKANSELTVSYEVHTLSSGKPAEVRVLYVGLAQAYYVSAGGEAGIGRVGLDGWVWEPSNAVAPDVLRALEIIQGKHSPVFVPLPVKLQ